ncbi:predicted protein, partial [Nematostella vectensis]
CSAALGMESHEISNIKSSSWQSYQGPSEGRLHFTGGFTASQAGFNTQVYLQVYINHGRRRKVTAVAVQPTYLANSWVYSYYISYSPRGKHWYDYAEGGRTRIFSGFRDRSTAVKSVFARPVILRVIRFNPITWSVNPALRVELYGCKGRYL